MAKSSPTPKSLIDGCRSKWDAYADMPTRRRLAAVGRHLSKMEKSGSLRVKAELRKCRKSYMEELGEWVSMADRGEVPPPKTKNWAPHLSKALAMRNPVEAWEVEEVQGASEAFPGAFLMPFAPKIRRRIPASERAGESDQELASLVYQYAVNIAGITPSDLRRHPGEHVRSLLDRIYPKESTSSAPRPAASRAPRKKFQDRLNDLADRIIQGPELEEGAWTFESEAAKPPPPEGLEYGGAILSHADVRKALTALGTLRKVTKVSRMRITGDLAFQPVTGGPSFVHRVDFMISGVGKMTHRQIFDGIRRHISPIIKRESKRGNRWMNSWLWGLDKVEAGDPTVYRMILAPPPQLNPYPGKGR
jgi:hypothetical protein